MIEPLNRPVYYNFCLECAQSDDPIGPDGLCPGCAQKAKAAPCLVCDGVTKSRPVCNKCLAVCPECGVELYLTLVSKSWVHQFGEKCPLYDQELSGNQIENGEGISDDEPNV